MEEPSMFEYIGPLHCRNKFISKQTGVKNILLSAWDEQTGGLVRKWKCRSDIRHRGLDVRNWPTSRNAHCRTTSPARIRKSKNLTRWCRNQQECRMEFLHEDLIWQCMIRWMNIIPLNGHIVSRRITNRLKEDIYQVNILHSKGIILSTQLSFKDQ